MKQTAPKGLSRPSRRIWTELTCSHDFADHELVAFERALKWWDVSDTAFASAEEKSGRERAELMKLALDASNSALRHWRTLKFPTPAGVRRPGRPAGDNWSAHRKQAANA